MARVRMILRMWKLGILKTVKSAFSVAIFTRAKIAPIHQRCSTQKSTRAVRGVSCRSPCKFSNFELRRDMM
eukprot:8916994-Pyramimonas_sp.AAC.1